MQARSAPAGSVGGALGYNEEKVEKGEAECIYAGNFLKRAEALKLDEKLERINSLMDCNQLAENKVMTVWLSFAPEERFDNERLSAIARSYMAHLGYSDQPYLVYRHDDTAIQHLHIVSTPVRPDGSLVRSFVPVSQTSAARKAVEMEFGLQKSKTERSLSHKTDGTLRITYGELPTHQVISDTLNYVLKTYNYRTLAELNAVLGMYNLRAITGLPNSRLKQHGGIVYQITDGEGKGKGKPVKASSISFKPTLKWLEKRFEQCKQIKRDVIAGARVGFTLVMWSKPDSNYAFQKGMRRNSLWVAPDVDPEGNVTGMLIVNIAAHTVVKFSELELGYDLADIRKKYSIDPLERKIEPPPPKLEQKLQHRKGLRL